MLAPASRDQPSSGPTPSSSRRCRRQRAAQRAGPGGDRARGGGRPRQRRPGLPRARRRRATPTRSTTAPTSTRPAHPGLLDAAQRPVRSPGLTSPSRLVGNHDLLAQGEVAGHARRSAASRPATASRPPEQGLLDVGRREDLLRDGPSTASCATACRADAADRAGPAPRRGGPDRAAEALARSTAARRRAASRSGPGLRRRPGRPRHRPRHDRRAGSGRRAW